MRKPSKPNFKYIAQQQEFAKQFMIGGVMLPLFKGDGSTFESDLAQCVTIFDLYRNVTDEKGLDTTSYIYPNENVIKALFTIRHKWTLGFAILCRDKTGKVYYVQQKYLVVDKQCNYEDIEEHLAEHTIKAFNAANDNYRLAICYGFIPDYDHAAIETHFNTMVYSRDILSNAHTRWERENAKTVPYYKAKTLVDFNYWFYHQKEVKPNAEFEVAKTRSFFVPEVDETQISGNVTQLHPIPELIPEPYRKADLVVLSDKIGFASKMERIQKIEFIDVKTEQDFMHYRELCHKQRYVTK